MLTYITIRNFKGFSDVSFELGNRVVFIGPNNSGKTSALQAMVLWDIGLKRWREKRGSEPAPKKRPGVTINRRDLIAVPVPDSNLLWRNLHVRESASGKGTQNVRIEIVVRGVLYGKEWSCGFEFDYANDQSFYCRPLRLGNDVEPDRMEVPPEAADIRLSYLPPMSGLAATETRLDGGAINVRLGEGRTAEVMRNLCYQVLNGDRGAERWSQIVTRIETLFGVQLDEPSYIAERGEISLSYKTGAITLDISSSGRGLQQTLLLMAHMMANQGSVLLLDEPDAHLEILRQRQIYQLLAEVAHENHNQLIAASHSEVLLNEAADRDMVVAFVGAPHRIDDRGSQVLKSLKEIGFDQYYQAEATGWVLYLEGSTDLAILRAFAGLVEHPAQDALERPFVHYVANQPSKAKDHFYGLREAKPDLLGIAVYDRLDKGLSTDPNLTQHCWSRNEFENYLCQREVLLAWATDAAGRYGGGELFASSWQQEMENAIAEIESALITLGAPSPWSADIKVTDQFLDPLFQKFFKNMKLPNLMRKTDYHELARYVAPKNVDAEIVSVLDVIERVERSSAKTRKGE